MSIQRDRIAIEDFETFVIRHEAKLRIALIAMYGPTEGRIAALDALSWAWEHWAQVEEMTNPVGYLYRVGQTSSRRNRVRPIPFDRVQLAEGVADPNIELFSALAQVTEQQRSAVMLTHAFGWSVRDVARMMDLAPSTVQTHIARGLERLRQLLEEHR